AVDMVDRRSIPPGWPGVLIPASMAGRVDSGQNGRAMYLRGRLSCRKPLDSPVPRNARPLLMFENRSIKLDLCALALSALVVFLGCALWTYDPLDPPSTLIYPASEATQNACGWAGALTAHFLFE